MNALKAINGCILFLLEGPRRPWWLAPVIWVVGVACIACWLPVAFPQSPTALPFWPWPALTLLPTLLASWWVYVRFSKRKYYKRIAKTADLSRCPACGYSFAGADPLPPARCSECGVDPAAYVEQARRLTE